MTSKDIRYLKGIGEKRAEFFKKLGINTVCALLRYYPRDWRDYSDITPIYNTLPDTVVAVKAKVVTGINTQYVRKNMVLYKFSAMDDSGTLSVTIFNNKYLAEAIKCGKTYVFYGKIEGFGANRKMSSPEIISEENANITPIYPTTAGLYQSNIRKAVKMALEFMPNEVIPDIIRERLGLCSIDFAIKNIHFPENAAALKTARKRLVFEELFLFRIGLKLMRKKNTLSEGYKINEILTDEFQDLLPFQLTESQLKVIAKCGADMQSGKQMNRLVQGDVGSGKTAIAAALMYGAAKSGLQSVIMAPTEILAEQHYKTLSGFFKDSGISAALLTGGLKKQKKEQIKANLKLGKIDIVVGTQALIQSDVEFNRLGLVVADEQHRFGVAQRAALLGKGNNPHMLVMSATPIPRTLALIIYGDLDISTVDSLPKGRKPIKTYSVPKSYRSRIYEFIKEKLNSGKQAYIVCPLVEENQTDLTSAEQYFEELAKGEFKDFSVGLLHGKMKPQEKERAMRSFLANEINLLVSTTVIEVGVDVPNATVMVIENAERFGLSQLHQLRGRVGRGEDQSYCILVSDAKGKEAKKRLDTMCKTTDGFKISETDLALRGPGDFLGNRQHGLPEFKIADLGCDMETLKTAGEAADWVLSQDKTLNKSQNANLKAEINNLFGKVHNELN